MPRVLSLEMCGCIIQDMQEFGTKSKICTNYFEKGCTSLSVGDAGIHNFRN